MHNSFLLKKIQGFIKSRGQILLRDVVRVQEIFSKVNFVKKAIENFEEESEKIFKDFKIKVSIDGIENFSKGIPIFSIYTYFQNNFIVHDPISGNFYFGNDNKFFVNNSFIRPGERAIDSIEIFDNNNIPETLLISWFLARSIDVLIIKNPNPLVNFLSNTNNIGNKIFFHEYVKSAKNFDEFIQDLSKKNNL